MIFKTIFCNIFVFFISLIFVIFIISFFLLSLDFISSSLPGFLKLAFRYYLKSFFNIIFIVVHFFLNATNSAKYLPCVFKPLMFSLSFFFYVLQLLSKYYKRDPPCISITTYELHVMSKPP